MVKKHKSFIKDDIGRGLGVLLGRGLLTSDGDTWRKSRRVILPHLQARALSRYALRPLKPFRPRLLPSITARPKDPVPMRVDRITARAVGNH